MEIDNNNIKAGVIWLSFDELIFNIIHIYSITNMYVHSHLAFVFEKSFILIMNNMAHTNEVFSSFFDLISFFNILPEYLITNSR